MEDIIKSFSFKDNLKRVLRDYESKNGSPGKNIPKGQAIRYIASSLIHIAINSKNDRDKLLAIKEIIDRLDGKPLQALVGQDGEKITKIERVVVVEDKQSDTVKPLVIDSSNDIEQSKLLN